MRDLRDAIRQFINRPGFTLTAVLTLALGIGANALVFGIVHAVLLKPLPFPQPDRLVNVWQTQPGNATRSVAPANFLDWRAASSFEGLAAYGTRRRSFVSGEPERILVATVSANFFPVLGVSALVGREFGPPVEDASQREVMLREDFWRTRFGADAAIVGRAIRLDEEVLIVAGIIPKERAFPEDVLVWTQARHDVPELGLSVPFDIRTIRDARYFRVLGRLRPGVTRTQAQAEMDGIAERLRRLHPDANADTGVNVVSLHEQLTGASSSMLWILSAIVGCVLAIACSNVAVLLLASAVGRRRELAIRTALGASRTTIVRQLAVESLLLGMAGAAAGLLLARIGQPAVIALLPAAMPRTSAIALDATVVAFTIGLSVATALAFGVGPALIGSRFAGGAALRDGGRTGQTRGAARASSTLVVVQLALALVLMSATGLMLRSLWSLHRSDAGMDLERVLAADVTLPDARSRGRSAAVADFHRMAERLATLPGVTGAGAIQSLPLTSAGPSSNIRVEGRTFRINEAPDVAWRTVTPGYFRAVGTPVLRGRAFTGADREGAPPVAIINMTMARLLWRDSDPIGARIGTGLDGDGAPVTIVGIVADTPQERIGAPIRPAMYRPLAQPSRFSADAMSLVVRTDGDPATLANAVRGAVRDVHPHAPVAAIRPLAAVAEEGLASELMAARALAIFGALALVLAAVGLHGVMARLVADRARELGVRVALGASPRDVRWLVLGRTLKLSLAGLVAGIVGAILSAKPLAALLHGVTPADPLVLPVAAAVLVGAALLASYLPAHRAARVDPLLVMKAE